MIGIGLYEALDELFDLFPEYIEDGSTRKKILIKTNSGTHSIIPFDIVSYYLYEANNITSGMRRLGDISGDWRPIDDLAKICLEIFKLTCPNVLRKKSKEWGLVPKF